MQEDSASPSSPSPLETPPTASPKAVKGNVKHRPFSFYVFSVIFLTTFCLIPLIPFIALGTLQMFSPSYQQSFDLLSLQLTPKPDPGEWQQTWVGAAKPKPPNNSEAFLQVFQTSITFSDDIRKGTLIITPPNRKRQTYTLIGKVEPTLHGTEVWRGNAYHKGSKDPINLKEIELTLVDRTGTYSVKFWSSFGSCSKSLEGQLHPLPTAP